MARCVQAQEDVRLLTVTKLQPLQRENRQSRATQIKWEEMNKAGLKLNANAAMGKLQHEILNWAKESRLSIAQRGDRPQGDKQFQKVTVHVSASQTMQSISEFLWRVNAATFPIRVTDLQIRPKREGSEELMMDVGISTLCLVPEKEAEKGGRP